MQEQFKYCTINHAIRRDILAIQMNSCGVVILLYLCEHFLYTTVQSAIQRSNSNKMSFSAVPVLDLAKANDPATKPELLEQLRHALMEVGFLYIRNTSISDELLEQVKAAGTAVFDIPKDEK